MSDTCGHCAAETTSRGSFQKVGKELCGCGDYLVRSVIQPRSTEQSSSVLINLQVHHERYVGDFNGGKDLSGCGGGMTPFATQARMANRCPRVCLNLLNIYRAAAA